MKNPPSLAVFCIASLAVLGAGDASAGGRPFQVGGGSGNKISVLGNKVIISQSPDVIVCTKDDQDHMIKKEILLKPPEIKLRRRSRLSMMPEDLMNYMTDRQLVDAVEYLTTLKEDRRAFR